MITLDEIEKSAMLLPDKERAELASHLLESLPPAFDGYDVGDEEVAQRIQETNDGKVEDISHEQLLAGLKHLHLG